MRIHASLRTSASEHHAEVSTDGRASLVNIAGRPEGGSTLNGGELLCLALATCYANDLYREAGRSGVALSAVDVKVSSEFGGRGEPARRISYSARVESNAPPDVIEALLTHTDTVAEVHNTLRAGIAVERRPASSLASMTNELRRPLPGLS